MEILKEFYNSMSVLDLVYLIITILSLIKCYIKGFVLSVLAMAKWLLAYVLTLIIFPRVKPYVKDIICLLYTSPSPRDGQISRMPSSA